MNPAFVVEIQMPDGKSQKKDNGLPIRRCAYELLAQFNDLGVLPNNNLIALISAFADEGLQEKDNEMFQHVCHVYCSVARKSVREVASKLNDQKVTLEKKFDFFCTSVSGNALVEAKMRSLLELVHWLNQTNQEEMTRSEIFDQFVSKIQQSKVA